MHAKSRLEELYFWCSFPCVCVSVVVGFYLFCFMLFFVCVFCYCVFLLLFFFGGGGVVVVVVVVVLCIKIQKPI